MTLNDLYDRFYVGKDVSNSINMITRHVEEAVGQIVRRDFTALLEHLETYEVVVLPGGLNVIFGNLLPEKPSLTDREQLKNVENKLTASLAETLKLREDYAVVVDMS